MSWSSLEELIKDMMALLYGNEPDPMFSEVVQ